MRTAAAPAYLQVAEPSSTNVPFTLMLTTSRAYQRTLNRGRHLGQSGHRVLPGKGLCARCLIWQFLERQRLVIITVNVLGAYRIAGHANWFTGTLSVCAQSKPVRSFLSCHIEKKASARTSTCPAAPGAALSVAVCHTPPRCLSVL